MNREDLLKLEPLLQRCYISDKKVVMSTVGLDEIDMGMLNEVCKLYLPVEVTRPMPDIFQAIYGWFFGYDLKDVYGNFTVTSFNVGFSSNEFTILLNFTSQERDGKPAIDVGREDTIVLSGLAERYQLCRILSQISVNAPVWKYKNTNFKYSFDGTMLNLEVVEDEEAVDVPA